MGSEMCIRDRPEVIQKEVNGEIHEPFEQIVIDIEEQHQGPVMEELSLIHI